MDCTANHVERVACGSDLFLVCLLREQASADPDERQAQLDQDRHRRQRPGHRQVEGFAIARLMADLLGATGDHFDPFESEARAGLHEEGGLGLVGLDEGDGQLRPSDLERKPGQAAPGADVNQPARAAEVLEEDQRVLDQGFRRTGDEPWPLGDQPAEL